MARATTARARFLRARCHPARTRRRTPLMGTNPATSGGWRLLRGLVVGLAATALGAGGHGLADGDAPAWSTVLLLAVLLGMLATWLSRARWTFGRLLGLLLLTQTGVHAVLVVTEPFTHPGHLHHAAEPTATLLPSDPAMLAGHMAAAALTALLLARGEAWLAGVLDVLALRAVRLLDAWVRGYGVRPQPLPVGALDRATPHVTAATWRERGPPR
jgi:hypothetical protein